MSKKKNKRWIFSRKYYYQSFIHDGSIIKVDGSFWGHKKDGSVVKVNGIVGRKVGSHQMVVFGNNRRKTIPSKYFLADNDNIRIRVK